MKAVLSLALCATLVSAYAVQRPPDGAGIFTASKTKLNTPQFNDHHPKPPGPEGPEKTQKTPKIPTPPKPPQNHPPAPTPYPAPSDTPSPTPAQSAAPSAADNWRDY